MTEETHRVVTAPPRKPDILAGILTYLVPGMGQFAQGRTTKAFIFFVSLHGLFFYGMWLGFWQNVYITQKDTKPDQREARSGLSKLGASLIARPHFIGQFFIGVAAWPAIYQYEHYNPEQDSDALFGKLEREPSDEKLNEMLRNDNKTWDLAWVYTVIAGVLNILVIYDAVAGAAFTVIPIAKKPDEPSRGDLKADEIPNHSPPVPPTTIAVKTVDIKREAAK